MKNRAPDLGVADELHDAALVRGEASDLADDGLDEGGAGGGLALPVGGLGLLGKGGGRVTLVKAWRNAGSVEGGEGSREGERVPQGSPERDMMLAGETTDTKSSAAWLPLGLRFSPL